MNVVSFETAKRLKDAGFPQPEQYKPGQVAYHKSLLREFVLCSLIESMVSETIGDLIAYAPTATELLPEGFFMQKSVGVWFVYENEERISSMNEIAVHPNPAEAAALAWLHENAK